MQSSHIHATSHSSEDDEDDEDESMSSDNSSRNRNNANNRHEEEEEALNHHGYYDEEEIDIDRIREQIFENAANSSSQNPYRELFPHFGASDSQVSAR